jgi:putative ABC transport system ATP-binding protein
MLELINIYKSYRIGSVQTTVLKGIDFSVNRGELLAVMGASGCGKSTLMNVIGLLDKPDKGEYFLQGQKISGLNDKKLSDIRNKEIGFVFQLFNLLPRLTALENVGLPLVYRGIEEKERNRLAGQMLERVNMPDLQAHKPTELSGGQQQRVAIARALVGGPSIILADEPTGALDTVVSREIMNLFKLLNREEKITIIIVTHNPVLGDQCNRIARMEDGVIRDM